MAAKVNDEIFYTEFGRALYNWSNVEHSLFVFFEMVTGLSEVKARAIFYSPNSLGARATMLKAVLDVSEFSNSAKELVTVILKKVQTYNHFRTALAHHATTELVGDEGDDVSIELALEPTRMSAERKVIVLSTLKCAAKNFASLYELIWEAIELLDFERYEDIADATALLTKLDALPSHADEEPTS